MVTILSLNSPVIAESHPLASILLCFPWAGGNGAYFRQWATKLVSVDQSKEPKRIQLLAINLPGRSGNVSNAYDNMNHVVKDTIQALEVHLQKLYHQYQFQPKTIPIIMFGHSLGALIALEVSKHANSWKSSLNIVHLCVSGMLSPDLVTTRNQESQTKIFRLSNDALYRHVSIEIDPLTNLYYVMF